MAIPPNLPPRNDQSSTSSSSSSSRPKGREILRDLLSGKINRQEARVLKN